MCTRACREGVPYEGFHWIEVVPLLLPARSHMTCLGVQWVWQIHCKEGRVHQQHLQHVHKNLLISLEGLPFWWIKRHELISLIHTLYKGTVFNYGFQFSPFNPSFVCDGRHDDVKFSENVGDHSFIFPLGDHHFFHISCNGFSLLQFSILHVLRRVFSVYLESACAVRIEVQ